MKTKSDKYGISSYLDFSVQVIQKCFTLAKEALQNKMVANDNIIYLALAIHKDL